MISPERISKLTNAQRRVFDVMLELDEGGHVLNTSWLISRKLPISATTVTYHLKNMEKIGIVRSTTSRWRLVPDHLIKIDQLNRRMSDIGQDEGIQFRESHPAKNGHATAWIVTRPLRIEDEAEVFLDVVLERLHDFITEKEISDEGEAEDEASAA